MKKNIALGILCTLGMADGAFATEWKTFDPDNSVLFEVGVYNSGAACTPFISSPLTESDRTTLLMTSYNSEFYYYECERNWADDAFDYKPIHSAKPCKDGMEVAVLGYADAQRYKEALEFGITGSGENLVWRCNDDGFNEWEFAHKEIYDCQDPAYTKFKGKTNAIPVLVSPSKGRQAFSYTYVNPPSDVCIAYICNPNTSIATMNPYTSSVREGRKSQYECLPTNPACSLTYGDKSIRMPTDYQYIGKLGSSFYTKANFPQLKTAMDASVERNQTLVDELYEKVLASHNIFESKSDNSGTYIGIKDNVLDNLNFYIQCTAGGLNFKPLVCPTYFKLQNGQCVLNTDSVQTAIDDKDDADRKAAADAVKNQRANCARLFCEDSGGVYDTSSVDYDYGNCTCDTTPCLGEYKTDDDDIYNYCYKQEILGEDQRCDKSKHTWSSSNTGTALEDDKKTWVAALKKCLNPASSGTSSEESISKLAGRLALVEDQFGLSKWRTAEGKFNTARLASDLTAGVVLGTTGALVTSSVVKKKQVKDGFESLECTVGGQHVGDWGDVFRIDGK